MPPVFVSRFESGFCLADNHLIAVTISEAEAEPASFICHLQARERDATQLRTDSLYKSETCKQLVNSYDAGMITKLVDL
jgi:hypothetical protein